MRSAAFLAYICAMLPLAVLAIESSFLQSNDGWIIIDHSSSTYPVPAQGINLTNSNPAITGGRLVVQDIGHDWNWLKAPSKFHLNWSTFDSLDIDLITDDSPTLFNLVLFIFDGTNRASFEFPIAGTPAGSVLNLSAPLSEPAWSVTGNWSQLVENVTAFYVRIDLNSEVAAEADYVDRIALVDDGNNPPPEVFPYRFTAEDGSLYQVQSSVDFIRWPNVGTPVTATGTTMQVDIILSDAPWRFFRNLKL